MRAILERLIQARKQAGLSQAQVARCLGYAADTNVYRWESGKRQLSVKMLLALADLYHVNMVWLLTGRNPDFDPLPIIQAAEAVKVAQADLNTVLDLLSMTAQGETI